MCHAVLLPARKPDDGTLWLLVGPGSHIGAQHSAADAPCGLQHCPYLPAVHAQATWMAFSDQVDWSSIAIVLHFTKIDRLPGIVNRSNVAVRALNVASVRAP